MYNNFNNQNNNNNNNSNSSNRERMMDFFRNDGLGLNNDPRKENFCNFIKSFFCPRLKFLSVTIFLLFINFIVFIIELSQGIETSTITIPSFLAVKSTTFKGMGSLV